MGPHGMVTAAWRGEGDRQGLLQKVARAGSPTHRSMANADAGLETAHTSAYFSCSKSHFPEPAGASTCTPMCVDMHTTHGNTHTVYTSAQAHTSHLRSDPGQTQTHGSTLHTRALPHTHTHTPVAVDLHFTHRHTHSNLQFCAQPSQEIETYMHRGTQPSVCSCMSGLTHR